MADGWVSVKNGGTRNMAGMDKSEYLQKIGKILKQRRESIGMSRSTLAMKIGTTYDIIRLYEEGKRAMRLDRLLVLFDALGLPVSGILSVVEKSGENSIRFIAKISVLDDPEYCKVMEKIRLLIETI